MIRLRTMPSRLIAWAKRQWHWMTTGDGPWNYAGCCGCGRTVVDVFLVIAEGDHLAPFEMYCRSCWDGSPVLARHDHIWFPETLVSVEWQFAVRVAVRAIEQREGGVHAGCLPEALDTTGDCTECKAPTGEECRPGCSGWSVIHHICGTVIALNTPAVDALFADRKAGR